MRLAEGVCAIGAGSPLNADFDHDDVAKGSADNDDGDADVDAFAAESDDVEIDFASPCCPPEELNSSSVSRRSCLFAFAWTSSPDRSPLKGR